MGHAQRPSPGVKHVFAALMLVAFSSSALAGPIRDAAEKGVPPGPPAPGKAGMHSPALFWGGVAAVGVGALFVADGVSGQLCPPTVPGGGHCTRKTEWAPVAFGIPFVSAGVVMMAIGGRHDRAASVDVAPMQVRLRIRF